MHLSSVYARDLGVKVGRPTFNPHFFPISQEKYITIHNGVKVPAKTYSYWSEVITMIKPFLQENGIKIYQIGLPDEPQINGIDKRIFTLTLKQTAFIIQNSLLMVGIDSVPIHIASALDVSSVGLYAHTYAGTCCPIWNKTSKASIIESERNGNKPSFSLQESPKTIDMIKPEVVARNILQNLGDKKTKLPNTIFIGDKYNIQCVDVLIPKEEELGGVPNLPNNTVVRMDLIHREKELDKLLETRGFEFLLKTSQPIDIKIIQKYKHRISQLVYEAPEFNRNFVNKIRSLGINFVLICNSPETLQTQRLKFFEDQVHYFNEREFKSTKAKEIKSKVKGDKKINFTTKKIYLYGQHKFSDITQVKKHCNLKTHKNDFFVDVDYMWIYTN